MLRKTIKKILALGTGATMVGATLLSATAAADLANYPTPFIKDGAFNAFLVVGDQAAADDVIGSIDIATSLQYAAKVKKTVATGTGTSVSLSGDSKKIEESTNKLELNETLNTIRSSVTGADLSALEDGSITNEHGTFKYTQVIELPRARVIFAKDTANSANVHDDETPTDYLYLPQTPDAAYNYTISFTPALKSDHNTGGSGYLDDIRGRDLKLFNKDYSIIKADHTSTNSISLTLMAGAVSDTLEEGETKTYTLNNKDYEVTLDYVGSADAKFTINSEVTDPALAETDTYRTADGTEIGVVDIMAQEFAGGKRKVQFDLGADKIVLADTSTNAEGSGGTVTIGTDESSNVDVDIITSSDGGTTSGADVKISSIKVWYKPSENLYVAKGESAAAIADAVEDESGVFFLSAFDYKYEGLSMDSTEEIKFVSDGANNYRIKFTNKAGVAYNEYFVAMNSSTPHDFEWGQWTGDALRKIRTNESETIVDEEFFIVNRNKYSRIMQFKDVAPGSNTTDNEGKMKLKDVGSGKTFDVSYSSLTGNLIVDGNTFQVNLTADASTASIFVDMNADGDFADISSIIYTKNEANITLANDYALADNSTPSVLITTPEDEDNNRNTINISFAKNSDNEADINAVTGTSTSGLNRVGSTYVYEDYTYAGTAQYGAKVLWDKKSSGADQDDVTITMPDSAARANFFVTSGKTETTVSEGGEGTVTYYETTPIEVGSAKLASEAMAVDASLNKNNYILVGGPCANAAAAKVMGNPADCAAGFEEGKAMIKLYESDGQVAMLVAGYSAMDTRRASRVVANYDAYKAQMKGKEVEVAGTSFTDITVSAPTPAAVTPAAGGTS